MLCWGDFHALCHFARTVAAKCSIRLTVRSGQPRELGNSVIKGGGIKLTHIAAAIFITGAKRWIRAADDAHGNGVRGQLELSFAQQVIQTAGYTNGAAIGS